MSRVVEICSGEARPEAPLAAALARCGGRRGGSSSGSGGSGRCIMIIMAARHGLDLQPPVASDCAPLWPLVEQLLAAQVQLHCLRDLTRGGLASALQELAQARGLEFKIENKQLPVLEAVARSCELLGFDPLHLANEGRFVAVLRVVAGPMAGAVGMPYGRFLVCHCTGAVLWATTMVSLAWLGGRWIPFQRMVQGVLQFGIGALVLVALIVAVPKLLSWWESRLLDRSGPKP